MKKIIKIILPIMVVCIFGIVMLGIKSKAGYNSSGNASGNASGNSAESGNASGSGDALVDESYECNDKKSVKKRKSQIADNEKHREKVIEENNKKDDRVSYVASSEITDYILETYKDAEKEALSLYSKWSSMDVVDSKRTSKYCLGVENHSQSYLNYCYNNDYFYTTEVKRNTDKKVDGTCYVVGMASLAEYYNVKKYAVVNTNGGISSDTIQRRFINMCDIAVDSGLSIWSSYDKTTKTYSGIQGHMAFRVLSTYYKDYGNSIKKGAYRKLSSANLKQRVIDKHNAAEPVVGVFYPEETGIGHAMTICGYYDVVMEGKRYIWSENTTKTCRYYMVNDGGKDADNGDDRIQYIRTQFLDSITELN